MTVRHGTVRGIVVLIAIGLVAAVGLVVGTNTPSADAAVGIDQCNNTGTTGGDTITCAVTITNNFTYNAATPDLPTGSATIVTSFDCTGSAVCPTGGSTTSSSPITNITQCNSTGLGGASTVTCTATVTNNLTGYPTGAAIDSTVVQCQSPGGVDTLTCVATPAGNDRSGTAGPGGQSVTQCNSSGGAGGTLTCTVTAPPSQSTGLPTTINECVASGTTGASTVTCTATITNNFFASTGPTTTVAANTTTTAPGRGASTTTVLNTTNQGGGTTTTAVASTLNEGGGSGGVTTTSKTGLPVTGGNILGSVVAGLVAVLLGTMMLLMSRRRSRVR
jgi:hypothetical protein